MKSKFLLSKHTYNGSQLKPLFNYLNSELLGDSIVSWAGPCNIPTENIVDGEDLLKKSVICSDDMLHFILELFEFDLKSAIFLQRFMAIECVRIICNLADKNLNLKFEDFLVKGDDVFWNDKKFNISIATRSASSSLIHFGINIKNSGTPVSTCCLSDFKIDERIFSDHMMKFVLLTVRSVKDASWKVKTV